MKKFESFKQVTDKPVNEIELMKSSDKKYSKEFKVLGSLTFSMDPVVPIEAGMFEDKQGYSLAIKLSNGIFVQYDLTFDKSWKILLGIRGTEPKNEIEDELVYELNARDYGDDWGKPTAEFLIEKAREHMMGFHFRNSLAHVNNRDEEIRSNRK